MIFSVKREQQHNYILYILCIIILFSFHNNLHVYKKINIIYSNIYFCLFIQNNTSIQNLINISEVPF